MEQQVSFAIGLGTFMRPQMLSNMLASLANLMVNPNWKVVLLLADNDREESARLVYDKFREQLPFQSEYLVEENRGIVHMRNHILDRAVSLGVDFIAFIDDDETVHPQWLQKMYDILLKYEADAVDGAVERILPPETPAWVRRGRFLKWASFRTGSLRKACSTSNVLFKRKLVDEWGLRFHPALNLAGASDTYLFKQAYLKGAKIVWFNEVYVQEHFPPSRVTRSWLLRRAFRRTNSKFIRKRLEHGYAKAAFVQFFNGVFQLVVGLVLSIITLPLGPMLRVHAQRIFAKGLGTFNGIFGRTYEEYRRTHGN